VLSTLHAYVYEGKYIKSHTKYPYIYTWKGLDRKKMINWSTIQSIILFGWKKGSKSHKTNFILPLYIEVPVPSQESEQSCMCVKWIEYTSISTFVAIWFWNCSDSVLFILLFVLFFILMDEVIIILFFIAV
jgi:hypothetical protein